MYVAAQGIDETLRIRSQPYNTCSAGISQLTHITLQLIVSRHAPGNTWKHERTLR